MQNAETRAAAAKTAGSTSAAARHAPVAAEGRGTAGCGTQDFSAGTRRTTTETGGQAGSGTGSAACSTDALKARAGDASSGPAPVRDR